MSAYADLATIVREGMPTPARRRRIAHARAQAAYDAVTAAGLPVTVSVGPYEITVHRALLVDQAVVPTGQVLPGLNLWGEVRRDGVRIDCDPDDPRDDLDHFHWPAPPLLVADPAGPIDRSTPADPVRRFREDPGAHLLQRIVDRAAAVS